jgi:hypothetical protein
VAIVSPLTVVVLKQDEVPVSVDMPVVVVTVCCAAVCAVVFAVPAEAVV